MIRIFSLVLGLMIASAAFTIAQTLATVTAEAVVNASIKPDQAKIYLTVESKAGDANSSVETNVAARKDLIATITKLGLKGVTPSPLTQRITKNRDNAGALARVIAPGGAPMPPPADTYTAMQMIVYTVSDPDPEKLTESVERITQAAATMGITGDKPTNDTSTAFNPYGGETRQGARVVFSSKNGWDIATADALAKATEKALRNAHALAKGAGLKVTDVVSVQEVAENTPQAPAAEPNIYAKLFGATTTPVEEEYVDGELIRKVRVRVKVAVSK